MAQLTIVYATETGNSEELARKALVTAKENGLEATLTAVEDYSAEQLSAAQVLLFIGSTQGEGEPPSSAWEFYDALKDADFDLSALKYGVVALGDTGYGEFFCAFGKFVDEQLARMGATALVPRVDCDYDFDADYAAWSERFFAALK